ncbi:MAG: anti-sigma factor, partial [Usitatibacteraceae bacterium]
MKLTDPELRSRLASEYVLGTLRGAARRRFEDHVQRDGTDGPLRAEVSKWENHLMPLAERLSPVDPHERVWRKIQSRIDGANRGAGTAKSKASLWESLAFWRSFSLGTGALAAVLLSTVIALRSGDQSPMLTAVLAEDNNTARAFIEQPKSGMLMVKMVTPWKTMNGMALELWVVPKNGAPRSLGIINESGETKLVLRGIDEKLADGLVFALSKEPPGGSPTGQPSPGSVMC